MAMQAGMGLSRIFLIFGAGYTGTVLMMNGKLSDVLAELQALLKGTEKQGGSGTDEGMLAQIRHLAMEVQHLGSTRQVTILNGTTGQGNITSLIVPAAAVGALGYGYMWWKGLSFSDLMYVTKKSMATAVSNLTKHLESVSEALAATKRHLTHRIENLDGKLGEQVEISKLIKNEVFDVHGDLSQIGNDLDALQKMLSGLDGKIMSLEDKQDLTNMGLYYLINYAEGRKTKMPESLQGELKIMGRSSNRLISSEVPSLKGLKDIADSLTSGNDRRSITNGNSQDSVNILEDPPRSLMSSLNIEDPRRRPRAVDDDDLPRGLTYVV